MCGSCKAPLEGTTNAQGQDIFRCPFCGISDTRENVVRISGEYVKEQAEGSLHKTLRKAAGGNRMFKHKSSFRPKGGHRFIVKLYS